MATFPSIDPSYGLQKRSEPKIRQTVFNDGYMQRIKFGLNQNQKEWNVTWQNITEADSDTIETFLDARADDGASFDWTPPNEASAGKYICPSWDKRMDYAGRATINTTFKEVNEP